jgi:hypothetical protein
VDIYDSVYDSFTVSSLSLPRFGMAAASTIDSVFFVGGYASNAAYSRVDIYNVTSGNWTRGSLTEPLYYLGGINFLSYDEVIFAGGLAYDTITSSSNYSQVVNFFKICYNGSSCNINPNETQVSSSFSSSASTLVTETSTGTTPPPADACPVDNPYRCYTLSNVGCVSTSSDCAITPSSCNSTFPFLCSNGTCVARLSDCGTCSNPLLKSCWNGACSVDVDDCLPVPSCPTELPKR